MGHVPDEPREFVEYVARQVRLALPSWKVDVDLENYTITVNSHRFDLEQLRLAVDARPADGDEIVEEHARHFAAAVWHLRILSHEFETCKDQLILRVFCVSDAPPNECDRVVSRQLVGELHAGVAIDLPRTVSPVSVEQVVRWGRDEEEVWDCAAANVANRAAYLDLKVASATDGTRFLWSEKGHYLNSALLALPDLADFVRTRLGQSPAQSNECGLFVPVRSVFFATSRVNSGASRLAIRRIADKTRDLPHRLLPRVICLHRDGLADDGLADE